MWCDRCGVPLVKSVPTKKAAPSRMCGCPFEIGGSCPQRAQDRIRKKEGLSDKKCYWRLAIINANHNHEPSDNPASHPVHCRLSGPQKHHVKTMTASNIRPAQQLTQLKKSEEGSVATNRTIYNTKVQLRKEELDGRTCLEICFAKLRASNWYYTN